MFEITFFSRKQLYLFLKFAFLWAEKKAHLHYLQFFIELYSKKIKVTDSRELVQKSIIKTKIPLKGPPPIFCPS